MRVASDISDNAPLGTEHENEGKDAEREEAGAHGQWW